MATKETKVVRLVRVPPGDRWQKPDGGTIHSNLTDALNSVFDETSITDFYIAAREGKVYSIATEEFVPPPPPIKTFSIYGDE